MTTWDKLKVGMTVTTVYEGQLIRGTIIDIGNRNTPVAPRSAIWSNKWYWNGRLKPYDSDKPTYWCGEDVDWTIIDDPTKQKVEVGKRYRKSDDYTRPIKVLYVDKQSVFYEVEQTGQRRHTGTHFTKDWTEILPEDWRAIYKRSDGIINISNNSFTTAEAAAEWSEKNGLKLIRTVRVDEHHSSDTV